MKLSKFQRLKRLHFYLWILAHGFHDATPTAGSEVTDEGSGSRHHTLPTLSFPWVAMVTQLPPSGQGSGWLSYNDIIPNMPLSLFCLLMPNLATGQVSKMGRLIGTRVMSHIMMVIQVIPAKYLCYFNDPEHQHKLVRHLPRRLRSVIRADRRDVSLVNQFLERMVSMELATVEGNLQTNKRRDQVSG